MDNRILRVAALSLAALLAATCGIPVDTDDDAPANIALSPAELDLFAGGEATLEAVVTDGRGNPVDETITWSSSDPGVATVDDGVVNGVVAGVTVITATAGDLEDEVTVTVVRPLDLVMPIGGTMNEDWYVTNYMDLEPGGGIEDYACGAKSYNGHQGLDLVLPSFAAMDAGVPVLAGEDGTVVWTMDGEPDRNKEWLPGVEWNAVGIDHGRGFEGWYGHLVNGSLRVSPGDEVEAGDTLGLVGSSGRSDMPHLHFELRYEGAVLDPFAGACGETADQWADPIPYQDEFALIDAGVTTDFLDADLERVKDPPTPATTITPGDTLYAWLHYHNVEEGNATQWTIRRPDGTIYDQYASTHSDSYSMSWWWYWTTTDGFTPSGTWTLEFRYDGALVAERSFSVSGVAAAVERAGERPEPASGTSGGGIR